MKSIPIFFDDLKPEVQQAIIDQLGTSIPTTLHWDTVPVSFIDLNCSGNDEENNGTPLI